MFGTKDVVNDFDIDFNVVLAATAASSSTILLCPSIMSLYSMNIIMNIIHVVGTNRADDKVSFQDM